MRRATHRRRRPDRRAAPRRPRRSASRQVVRRVGRRARTASRRPLAASGVADASGEPSSSNSRPPAPTTSSKKVPNNPDSRPGNPNAIACVEQASPRVGHVVDPIASRPHHAHVDQTRQRQQPARRPGTARRLAARARRPRVRRRARRAGGATPPAMARTSSASTARRCARLLASRVGDLAVERRVVGVHDDARPRQVRTASRGGRTSAHRPGPHGAARCSLGTPPTEHRSTDR